MPHPHPDRYRHTPPLAAPPVAPSTGTPYLPQTPIHTIHTIDAPPSDFG